MRSVNSPLPPAVSLASAAAGLLLALGVAGCAASKDAAPETPAAGAAQETKAMGQPGQYPAPTDQANMQAPAVPDETPFDEFDRAERELTSAVEGKPMVAEGMATGDKCTIVCKALASMRKSADQICTLDATRCTDARARLTKAEERAKGACPACSSTPT